jgi:poly-gamma-glutamate synthesis protein (capsule biosynthesis protein)
MAEVPIRILVTGDLCPINRVEKLVSEGNYEGILNDFNGIIRDNDLTITDLECPLTSSESSRKKIGPHQKAHPDCINLISFAGINLVTLANNHIMDYGSAGLIDTLTLCRSKNISTVGVGTTVREASEPYFTTINNRKLAVLNCADDEFVTTPDHSYKCNSLDPVQLHNTITRIRNEVDYIIVIVHAGNEYYSLPSPRTKALYRFLVDCGADAVLANHSHAFSGYEVYKSKPVFYGLGNFIYDWPGKEETSWYRGFVVRLRLSETINYDIIPFKQGGKDPGIFLLNEIEMKLFSDELERLNSIIEDDSMLENSFKAYCNSVSSRYDAYIEPYFGRYLTTLRNRGFLPKLMSKRKRLLLLNIIRCASHREVLTTLLRRYE